MPFVTTNGSKKLNWDITYDEYDPRTGIVTKEGNGLRTLDITAIERFDYQPHGELAKKMVWRGQPNPIKMCWEDMPVFRVLTEDFEPCPERLVKNPKTRSSQIERETTDWGRFMRDYQKECEGRIAREIYYEPASEDIRTDLDPDRSLPLWVIEQLLELGEFQQALVTNKVGIPGQVKLTKPEFDRIMKEIRERKQQNANVPRPAEQGQSKEVGITD